MKCKQKRPIGHKENEQQKCLRNISQLEVKIEAEKKKTDVNALAEGGITESRGRVIRYYINCCPEDVEGAVCSLPNTQSWFDS